MYRSLLHWWCWWSHVSGKIWSQMMNRNHDQCDYCFVGYSVQFWRSHNVWLVHWVPLLVSSKHQKHLKHVSKIRCWVIQAQESSQVSQSSCQCFGSLVLSLYAQETLLGAGSPVLMEIIMLECHRVWRGWICVARTIGTSDSYSTQLVGLFWHHTLSCLLHNSLLEWTWTLNFKRALLAH